MTKSTLPFPKNLRKTYITNVVVFPDVISLVIT